MNQLIAINVPIGDRTYRIKIAVEDEEQVRKTLKIINDKIIEFKTEFAGKDMQDYISMVLLWMIACVFFGIFLDFAFFEGAPNWKNIIFYILFLISLGFLIRYLIRKWKL